MSSKKKSTVINDSTIQELFNITEVVSENKDWGFDLNEEQFIKGMLFLKPQSYGSRIETYIIRQLGWKKVKASEGCGDARTENKTTIEIKTSILTPTNDSLNLVQIRLFHNIDFYLCVAYDLRDIKNYKKYMFLLSHDDMVRETQNASAAHGTKKINELNKNVELRVSLVCDNNDSNFLRWCKQYRKSSYNVVLTYVQ